MLERVEYVHCGAAEQAEVCVLARFANSVFTDCSATVVPRGALWQLRFVARSNALRSAEQEAHIIAMFCLAWLAGRASVLQEVYGAH